MAGSDARCRFSACSWRVRCTRAWSLSGAFERVVRCSLEPRGLVMDESRTKVWRWSNWLSAQGAVASRRMPGRRPSCLRHLAMAVGRPAGLQPRLSLARVGCSSWFPWKAHGRVRAEGSGFWTELIRDHLLVVGRTLSN
jgi:hypothetical protein